VTNKNKRVMAAVPLAASPCDFCDEFESPHTWRFADAYGGSPRLLELGSVFRLLPTVGQLVDGSLLLLPTTHQERFADLPRDVRTDAASHIELVISMPSFSAGWLLFEHGARAESGGGCGLYHAHMHIVPLASPPKSQLLLGEGHDAASLSDAWDSVATTSEYLVCATSNGDVRCLEINASNRHRYPSQFFRRRVRDLLGIHRPWDWREFDQPEPAISRWMVAAVPAARGE